MNSEFLLMNGEDLSLNILKFETMTDEWLDFIASCRVGKIHNYDIV